MYYNILWTKAFSPAKYWCFCTMFMEKKWPVPLGGVIFSKLQSILNSGKQILFWADETCSQMASDLYKNIYSWIYNGKQSNLFSILLKIENFIIYLFYFIKFQDCVLINFKYKYLGKIKSEFHHSKCYI